MNSCGRILIIDDDPDMLWVLESVLRCNNFEVSLASTGAEAIAISPETKFDLALLDAKLPDMDGLKIASLIKASNPSTKIVMVSGYYYEHDDKIQEALKTGLIIHFIPKPFSNGAVLKAIDIARSVPEAQAE
jgi:DNA-binding NtrC family response regulator